MQQNDNANNDDLPSLKAIPVQDEPLQRNQDAEFQPKNAEQYYSRTFGHTWRTPLLALHNKQ